MPSENKRSNQVQYLSKTNRPNIKPKESVKLTFTFDFGFMIGFTLVHKTTFFRIALSAPEVYSTSKILRCFVAYIIKPLMVISFERKALKPI